MDIPQRQVISEDSHPSLYHSSISTLFAKYYLKAIINETESVRSFKTVTWHCLQPAPLGTIILIICLLFQSPWDWCHSSTIRVTVQEQTYAVPAPSFGTCNLKFWRPSFLSCCLLWAEHTPFRTAGFQKVSLADLFCLLHDNQKNHMIL